MIITIDGPVASGKSSVARLVAQRLGFFYLNTGLLYRAVAYVFLEKYNNIPTQELVDSEVFDITSHMHYVYDGAIARILFDGVDITDLLSATTLDQPASLLSAIPSVRAALLAVQRACAAKYNVVADGRDCGTVVFPNADYKFYLEASLAERARRLMADSKRKGQPSTLADATIAIKQRDARDMQRAIAPLRVPDDAFVIDSTALSLKEVVGIISSRVLGEQKDTSNNSGNSGASTGD